MLRTRLIKFVAALAAVATVTAGAASADSTSPTVQAPPAYMLDALMASGKANAHFPEQQVVGHVDRAFDLPKGYDFAGVPRFGKAILVNIPSAELIAFEDGIPVLRSRVIVGKRSSPTPIMRTETSVVRFRPTWTPTRNMIRKGIKPGTRRGGKGNPLGYVAIRLEPGMLIYLHGTNKPHLFKRNARALSWGCVRVDRWKEVTAWVLGTDNSEVERRAFGRRTHDVGTNNIPVIIGYWTEFPNAEGKLVSHKDVYRRGRKAAWVEETQPNS